MIQLRKSKDRGHANHGWLDTYHTFSFSDYYDPRFTGFRELLVINEDVIQPGQGFGKHPHRDMEIVTYILEGELEHRDSMGSGSVIRPGDVQRMSAGTGVTHSEFNHSKSKPVHLLQIWIAPGREGLKPEYEEKKFAAADKTNSLKLIVAPKGEGGAVAIHQDARIYSSILETGRELRHQIEKGRHAWVQVARGAVELNGLAMSAGDGAALSDERELKIIGQSAAELLVFDLP